MAQKTKPIPKPQRLVSLALFLSDRNTPASKTDIAREVEGYSGLLGQDGAADKMLDRDLASLKELGLIAKRSPEGGYFIEQPRSTTPLELSGEDALRLRLMCLAPLCDPSFVYDRELRSALTKLSSHFNKDSQLISVIDELPPSPPFKNPDEQEREVVKKLKACCELSKSVNFYYIDASGHESCRSVQPHGLIAVEQDWYLIGFDLGANDTREFRVSRMHKVKQENAGDTPDFEKVDFNVQEHLQFPFSFGDDEPFEVVFLLPSPAKASLCERWANIGVYRIEGDEEHLLMVATARSVTEAARWAVEYSGQAMPLYPQELVDAFLGGLEMQKEVS